MGIFLDYTSNISEFTNRKTQPQFENSEVWFFIEGGGGGGHRFWAEDFLNFKMSYLL